MKRFFLSLILLAFFAPCTFSQRLPDIAAPENYQLTFAPDFLKDNFAGDETIQIRILKPTSQIVLNSAEIDFQQAVLSSHGMEQKAAVTVDKDKEMATLSVERTLEPGPATIRIQFRGILNDELRGLYLGRDRDGNKYAVTQFEATDARRAFPSFDEPAFKATFDIAVTTDKDLTAISNGRVISDTPGPGENKHTVRFATTARMSSYLVALAVGRFESVEGEADGIPIRIWGPPGSNPSSAYALKVAEWCMKYFNQYFDIKYPFEKLDMIGLPDFSAGAMENTGLITYRQAELQLDDKQASVELRQTVATVIAHEMAHQWFGDLVTMQWWDDIWLNEGFATWMENKAVGAWKPEWHLEVQDAEDTSASLNIDSLQNTRPIQQAADSPAQIQELFDGIAYDKAAAVLRMLEAYLGPETFRAGVIRYLKQHSYGNATADDFWKTQAEVSGKPVDQIMPSFVKQPGAPMINVRTQCSQGTTTVTLAQTRYFSDRELFAAGTNELWQVPVCIKEGGNSQAAPNCVLLTRKQEDFPILGCGPWTMVNAGAHGYYRSGYSSDATRAMGRSLEYDFSPSERITLLGDTWASVRVGSQPIGDYLTLVEGLKSDQNQSVISQVTSKLEYIGDFVVNEAERGEYERWVRRVLGPSAAQLGWQPRPGEADEIKSMRAKVLYALGHSGRDPAVIAEAKRRARKALQHPDAIDPTVARAAFWLAAENGDASFYDQLMKKLQSKGTTLEHYYLYFQTISRFRDPRLLQRTLDFAISPAVRSQDTLGLVSAVMDNPAGSALAWDFVRSHWSDLDKVGGGFTSGEVVAATGVFCDGKMHDEVQDFFSAHSIPTAERTLRQSLEKIRGCADLRARQSPELAGWLRQRGAASGK
jgi:aminopeptidase N